MGKVPWKPRRWLKSCDQSVGAEFALPAALFVFSTQLAAQSLVWSPQGPAPTALGQVEGISDRPVAGAIRVAAPHPSDPNIVYVGAVNGGVWKTTDAMSPNPSWEPLTDDARSLSIGALAFDPTDATHQTLVAGTGRYSSNNRTGTALIGLMRTTDGGASWEVIDGGKLVAQRSDRGRGAARRDHCRRLRQGPVPQLRGWTVEENLGRAG